MFIPSYSATDTFDAVQPALSPDGQVLLMGHGRRDNMIRNVVSTTLDPTIASPNANYVVANYADTNFAEKTDFPILTPRLAPDGTRLALGSKQIWAARRNMSSPPRITQVGTQSVVDSTAKVSINAARGLQTSVQVLATDPESDGISCSASFLQDGMSFDAETCTLTWTPTLPIGTTVYVKFVVSTETWPRASGGTDAILAALTVIGTSRPQAMMSAAPRETSDGPNPTHGAFAITPPGSSGAPAKLVITDIAGRKVAVIIGQSGHPLIWDSRIPNGTSALSGVYLYRLEFAGHRSEGKIMVVH